MKSSLSGRLGAYIALFGLLGIAVLRHLVESNPYTYPSHDGRYLLLTVLIVSGMAMLLRALKASFRGRLGAYIALIGLLGVVVLKFFAGLESHPYRSTDSRYFVPLVLIIVGLAVFLRALDAQFSEDGYLRAPAARLSPLPGSSKRSAASTPSLTLAEIRNLTSFRQRRKPPGKLSLPASYFGLLGALLLAPLWVFLMALGHKTSYGLKVYLSRPVAFVSADAVWEQRLLVQVDSQGHWYLNSQPIRNPYLESQIKDLVAHRAGRLVYLTIDRSAPYKTAIHAVETLQQAWNARVVMVTEDELDQPGSMQKPKNLRRRGKFVPKSKMR